MSVTKRIVGTGVLPGERESARAMHAERNVDHCRELAGARVLVCGSDGLKIGSERDVNVVIAAAREHDAVIVALPITRLSDDFLDLRSPWPVRSSRSS